MRHDALYRDLITQQIPLLDVRAPSEFNQGHIPSAKNFPLLNDAERHEIGLVYKKQGQDAAIARGEKLISGDLKQSRLTAWADYLRQHPHAQILCFRGGLRSRITQQWLKANGLERPLVPGGYKMLRRYLLSSFDPLISSQNIFIISGRTGSGKTQLLQQLPRHIDLEAIAHHRGSSFGRHLDPQPTQAVFENRLMATLLQLTNTSTAPIYIEDESNNVGSCHTPLSMRPMRKQWPLLVIEDPLEARVQRTREEYIDQALLEHRNRFGAKADERLATNLLDSLERIQKRLGGVRYGQLQQLMNTAIAQGHDPILHEAWIRELLADYYDPMYDYQLEKKKAQVLFRGSRNEVLQWCQENDQKHTLI